MRKYKQAIQIGNNITDIFNLPCVERIEKERTVIKSVVDLDYIEFTDVVYTLKDGTHAGKGNWLLQDVCGNWHVMTDEKYQKHKDDEKYTF